MTFFIFFPAAARAWIISSYLIHESPFEISCSNSSEVSVSREKAMMPRLEERAGMAVCALRRITWNSKWLLHCIEPHYIKNTAPVGGPPKVGGNYEV